MTEFFAGYITVTSPRAGAVTGTQLPVNATATEANASIYQLQVWDRSTGQKLAESATGTSTFQQTLQLTPGTHQLVIENIAGGSFRVLHKAVLTVTARPDGVAIASPLPNATCGPSVLVSASAIESASQIDHLEVWDSTTGRKLGESGPGTPVIHLLAIFCASSQLPANSRLKGTLTTP
jgi:hypothetical protein